MAKAASPLARSGLATTGAGPAAIAVPATNTERVADIRRETIDFMVVVQKLEEWAQNPRILQ
jgi:hypothetical protein